MYVDLIKILQYSDNLLDDCIKMQIIKFQVGNTTIYGRLRDHRKLLYMYRKD